MIRLIKRIGILFGIFAAAVIIYIVVNREQVLPQDTVYVAMEDSALPVAYVNMYGRRMNPMHGYRQDMGNAAASQCLTVLPEDRRLSIEVPDGEAAVTAARYEIRSLDLQRLVENTELDTWEQENGTFRAELPVQNLLAKDREYLLCVELDMEETGTVRYYTRIVWTDDGTAQGMIDLAVDFSAKTFDYEQARSLVTYLETSPTEDNSSFGSTTIRSSFSQLTWGRLNMQPASEVQVTLKEKDGIMGCVSLSYLASREDENGTTEYYDVKENFTMKWNAVRIYMMDYERIVDQVITGERESFSGKRIMLGITGDERVEAQKSAGGQILAYRANRDLWSYNQKENRIVKIFSFRGSDFSDVQDGFADHDVKILRVDDGGDVDFLVYGYQNRGRHEGEFGIAGYHYDADANALQERFFIPAACQYEELEADISRLAYQAQSDMLYLYLGHAVFGIDLTSNEHMVVADGLEEGSYAVSADQSRIAWLEGGERYESQLLHLMDLETGEKMDIHAENGEYVRTLGFVGRDLVYGRAKEDAVWMKNGRIVDFPMYAVEIMNDQMQVETRYEKSGYLVAGVTVDDSRIHLRRVTRSVGQDYLEAQEDTIVCNAQMGPGKLEGIGWYASQDKGKLYFVQIDQDMRSGRSLRVLAPKKVSIDQSDRLDLTGVTAPQSEQFYAYGGGRLLGVTGNFSEAVALAYDRMGIVTDSSHRMLWGRVNRSDTAAIRDISTAYAPLERHLDGLTGSRSFSDGVTVLDARGCSMQQMLYFIGRGIPVMGYTGEGSYLILCGYDSYNVTVYDPATRETYKAGLNDSTEFFRQRGNDFVCAVSEP